VRRRFFIKHKLVELEVFCAFDGDGHIDGGLDVYATDHDSNCVDISNLVEAYPKLWQDIIDRIYEETRNPLREEV
jgi:hypothetical protein